MSMIDLKVVSGKLRQPFCWGQHALGSAWESDLMLQGLKAVPVLISSASTAHCDDQGRLVLSCFVQSVCCQRLSTTYQAAVRNLLSLPSTCTTQH
jgi:hypothetical protein